MKDHVETNDIHLVETNGIKSKRGLNAYNVLTLMFISIGSMSYGYTAAVIGTTLGQPSFAIYFDLATRSNATDLISSMQGVFQAGGVFGALLIPWFADKFGRKWAIATSCFFCIFAGAMLAGSTNPIEFIIIRFVSGLGAFMILTAVPIWMNEVVPEHIRGALVAVHAVGFVFGYTVSGWIGFAVFFWDTPNAWRLPLALQCVFPLICCAGLFWMPESPRWLAMQDKHEQAKEILDRLHANSHDPEHVYARTEFLQIQKQIEIDRILDSSWIHMFKKPSYRKRSLLAIGTTGFIQFSGVLVINNYGPSLYKALGYSADQQLEYPAAWLTFGWGCAIIAVLITERLPRNILMAIGMFGCCATLTCEAALVATYGGTDNKTGLRAAVAMFFTYEVFYGGFLDGAQFAYLGEIFPNHIRAKGVGLGVAMISLMNVIWLQAEPTAFAHIGWKFYLIFIIGCFVGGWCILLFWPDTRGLPLEEIAAIFGDADEVAIYQRDIHFDESGKTVFGEDMTVKQKVDHKESA